MPTEKEWEEINYRRMCYIDKRNSENEEIGLENGLTENQIEAIEDICCLRHEIHCTDVRSIVSQTENDRITEYLAEINSLIDENNLPEIDVDENTYLYDWLDDLDWYELAEETRPKYYEQAKKKIGSDDENALYDLAYKLFFEDAVDVCGDIKEKINNKIESWLRDIDTKYGTSYTPSGAQRIY